MSRSQNSNRLRALGAEPWQLYRAKDRAAGELRAQHLAVIRRSAGLVMGANVAAGLLLATAIWQTLRSEWVLLWLSLLVAGSAWGLWRARATRERAPAAASARSLHRMTVQAALLGCVWAAAPLVWFLPSNAAMQLVIATTVAGVMGVGAVAMATAPLAAVVFVGILFAGLSAVLLASGDPAYLFVEALLALYALAGVGGALWICSLQSARFRSAREANRQGQVVGLLLRDFEEHSTDVLWEIDRQGRFSHVSRKLSDLLGYPPSKLQTMRLVHVLHQLCPLTMKPDAANALQTALTLDRAFRDMAVPVEQTSGTRWWSITAKPLLDEQGRNIGWRGVISDVTQERQAHQRLAYLAHFDSLTGLANRVQLRERLAQALEDKSDPPRRSALLSLDVDNFKTINDSLGHSVGDAVLQAVAKRLLSHMRQSDLVARLGGDEFAMVLDDVRVPDEVPALAQRLVQAMKAPCEIEGRTISIGISIGIALIPDHGSTVDEVLGNVDLALYAAKEGGRGRYEMFAPRLGARHRRRLSVEHELRQALRLEQFQLHFQPQVDLNTWSICGCEALVRWHHPVLGHVPPSEFIPVAEEAGLIVEMGTWVLFKACREAARHLADVRVSVNVSPMQLLRPEFVQNVERALADSGLPADRLEIEITESLFMEEVPIALGNLHAIKQMGVRIALDDFGTGYSSLAYLRRFPFDTLKIDRAFVRELMTRSDARAIVRTIMQLAGTLGMSTVAEGVEEPAQLEVLQRAHCHAIQGFLAARPMPMPEFRALIEHWHERGRPISNEELPESVLAPLPARL